MPQRKNRNRHVPALTAARTARRGQRHPSTLPSAPEASAVSEVRRPGQARIDRRAHFLELVRDNDVLRVFANVTDDTLIDFGKGMAYEAIRGEYYTAHGLARNIYRIPDDAVELATAAALTAFYPHAALGVLMRPNEASIHELRRVLGEHGFKLTSPDPRG